MNENDVNAGIISNNEKRVGETGAHWDTGYSGTVHILEILTKRMP